MKKCVFLTMLVILLTFSYADAKSYTFVVCPWAGFELFWVAGDKGFFERENLDIDFRSFSNVPDWVNAIRSGRFDFMSIYFSNAMLLWFDDTAADPVFLGTYFHEEGYTALVSRKGLSGKRLKGEKVGVDWASSANNYILYKYLKPFDLGLSDIRFVILAHDDLVTNFVKGRLNVINTIGDGIDRAVRDGNGMILTSTREHYEATITGIFTPAERLKAIPVEDVKKFWRALFAARKWMYDPRNLDELKSIAEKHFYMVPVVMESYSTKEKIKRYQQMFKTYTMEEADNYNRKIPEFFDELMDVLKQIGHSGDLSYETVSDLSAFSEVMLENSKDSKGTSPDGVRE